MAPRSRLILSSENLTVVGHRPVSRSASLGRNVGAFAFLLAFVAVVFHVTGAANTPTVLIAFAVVLAFATIGLLLSARALAIIWARGKSGLGDALLGIAYGVVLWSVPIALIALARLSPQVSDVVTEGDPPSFLNSAVRPSWANPVELTKAMPEALSQPLLTETSLTDVYDLGKVVGKQMGWVLVQESPPISDNSELAAFQATSTSALGFTDDIIVEFTTLAKKTTVTMRSASRIGSFDFGVNAARIDEFMLTLRQKLNER